MTVNDVLKYLLNNEISEDNAGFVKKHLEALQGEGYRKGYSDCLSHIKKRKCLEEARHRGFIKKFLDYLSDLTHTPNKA